MGRLKNATLSLTAVIPTKNRPDDLALTIESLLRQTVLPEELIIVDQSSSNASQDQTMTQLSLARSSTQNTSALIYIRDPNLSGLTAARNRSLGEVRTELVLFLDDDVVLESDFVEQILETYRQYPNATGVSGIVTNYSLPPVLSRYWTSIFARGIFRDDRQPVYWRAQDRLQLKPVRVSRLGGGLMSFRMRAIEGVRFDESLIGACDGEDVDFTVRLGSNAVLLIAPKARLLHKQTPIARTGEHWLQRHCRTHWYLYRRNWNSGVRNRLPFVWLNVGYLVAALAVSVRHRSFSPWAQLFGAVRQSRVPVSQNSLNLSRS